MTNIAKNIKKLRNVANMTQEELAERLHVTRQAISSWENGKNQPDVQTLEAIAKEFGVTIEEVIYGTKSVRNRKKLIVRVIILAAITLVCFVILYHVGQLISDWIAMNYIVWPKILYLALLRPVVYVLIGTTVGSFVSVFASFAIKKQKNRRICVALGIVIAVGLSLWGLSYFHTSIPITNILSNIGLKIAFNTPVVYIVPGILLWLGVSKEPRI